MAIASKIRIGKRIISTMNYFAYASAAERYAHGRPYFHPAVIARVVARLGMRLRVPAALDVGCGTGQSTGALAPAAERIVGIDTSADMLAQACWRDAPGIAFVRAAAEVLP